MLLDHEMRVGAAEAERTDRRAPHLGAGRLPRLSHRIHDEGRAIERDVLVQRIEVNGRRNLSMPDGLQYLDHSRHAGGHQGVPDIALHRPERAVTLPGCVMTERVLESFDLDRVAE